MPIKPHDIAPHVDTSLPNSARGCLMGTRMVEGRAEQFTDVLARVPVGIFNGQCLGPRVRDE